MSENTVEETSSADASVDDDIATAIAEAEKEGASEGALATEEEQTETPVEEEAPAEEEKTVPQEVEQTKETEQEEEDFGLSAEQLEKLQSTPEGVALYKSMQRGMTKKAQALSEQRKELDEKVKFVDWITENPDDFLEKLAEKRGRRIAPREEDAKVEAAVDKSMEKWSKLLGSEEAAKAFLPAIREDIMGIVKEQMQPLTQRQQEQLEKAQIAEYSSGIAQFEATIKERGEPYDMEIQTTMAEKMKSIVAADGVSLQEYLGTLYDAVMMDRTRIATKKAALTKLRKAQTKDEPTVPARSGKAGPQSITADMSDDDAIALAVKMAEAGQ